MHYNYYKYNNSTNCIAPPIVLDGSTPKVEKAMAKIQYKI